MSKRIISPLEIVLKQFKNCVGTDREQTKGIVFNRKDNMMEASVCDGYICGIATYEDKGEDISISLSPACYDAVRLFDIQDLQRLGELVGTERMPDSPWSNIVHGEHGEPEEPNTAYLDSNILKKVFGKVRYGGCETTIKVFKHITKVEYTINDVHFEWIVLGIRKCN